MQHLPHAAIDRGAVIPPQINGDQPATEEQKEFLPPRSSHAVSRETIFMESALSQGSGEILYATERDFVLASGVSVPNIRLGFCVYGTHPENPLVVIHPALTGSPRARREAQPASVENTLDTQGDGWWDDAVGPGKLFDTNRYTVMSVAHVGGIGHSSSAAELSDYPISIADTVRLTAQVLRRNGVRDIAAVVGGSMGAYQALYWLYEDNLSIGTLVDVCGSSPGRDTTAEFFAAQRDLLRGAEPLEIARRIALNCSELGQSEPAFGIALEHVISKIAALAEGAEPSTSTRLAVTRQIGFLRFVAPGFYTKKIEYYLAKSNGDRQTAEASLKAWLDRQGLEFQGRFNPLALENLCSMLADPPAIKAATVAHQLVAQSVTLRGLSVDGDTLWPARDREDFYSEIRRHLPKDRKGLVHHLVVEDHVNGHDFFLSKSFPERQSVWEFLGQESLLGGSDQKLYL